MDSDIEGKRVEEIMISTHLVPYKGRRLLIIWNECKAPGCSGRSKLQNCQAPIRMKREQSAITTLKLETIGPNKVPPDETHN